MATVENTPVREIPGLTGEGLKRTKVRLRKLGCKASEATGLTKLFGTPENPTKLGRVMDFVGSVAESAPTTGMIIRNPAALNPKMVAKADQMLGGRMWSDLARDERLAIKKATGLEQVEGGLPGWAMESATDPVLKARMTERAAEWQRGDRTSGKGMGTYRDIVTGGEDYVRSLDEGAFAWVQMRKARRGEQGSFDPYNETLYLTENAKLSGTGSTVIHEGQHMSQDLARQAIREKDVPYGYKPSEIEARIAERRAELTPEQRSNSLLEESQNNWGEKWYHEEMKIEQQKLRQAAKGGNAPGESKPSAVPKGHNTALDGYSGPRVVINPQVMKDDRDALCVAFNESFRIIQEINGFDPIAEPTEKQRAFFADTAYRDDERMLRRTILSRICTFDTSVTDPTDEQLQEAVEFLDTVLEIGAPQNQWEQRAVERIRTAISKALESGERVPASQAPAPEGSPEVAAGGAGSSAGGVPEDEEKDSGAEFRENAQAQMDEAAKLAQEGPTAEEQKVREMADAAGKAAGDDPFGKSAEMKAAAQEAGLKADISEARKPENLMQKNGHYVDAQGRVISERAAKALAEQGARNAAAQDTNDKQQAPVAGMDAAQNSPRTASERIGTTSGIKAPGGRELTAGEAAWEARKQASTAAWMQRTGRSGDGVADALAQRDELANNLRQSTQVDSGRRDALGRRLDDRGRVIV